MRSREHDPRRIERTGRIEQLVARDEAQKDHVYTCSGCSLRERGHQLDARRAHVAADDDRRALGEGREGGADLFRQLGIELVWHDTPDVISLEDVV